MRAAAGDMQVARELYPLPTISACSIAASHNDLGPSGVSRSVRRRRETKSNWRELANSCVNSLNELFGAGSSGTLHRPSAAQLAAVEHVGERVRCMGKPLCTAAEALSELCGAQGGPDLYGEATPRATYQRDCVSLPEMGGLVRGEALLTGKARELWCDWREHLLRAVPAVGPSLPARPYSDAKLVENKREYAAFIASLADRGLVRLGEQRRATVGVFFVGKKVDPGAKASKKLRMILDTRLVNLRFEQPAYTQLPTPSSWSHLRIPPGQLLILSQCDVDCAFYRIHCPDGLGDFFCLPPVDLGAIREIRPELAASLRGKKATPRLLVLAMGFSSALHFCQLLVSAAVAS